MLANLDLLEFIFEGYSNLQLSLHKVVTKQKDYFTKIAV
jgi:hypothetical protein